MIDKELIKQEIERRINLIQDTNVTSYADGWIQAYKELLQFIDSLPEEPVKETVKENYNERYKRIAQTEQFKKTYCDKSLGKEEPASKDLEEEISNYIKNNFFGSGSMGFFSNRTKQELNSIDVVNIARHFANWQHGKDFDDLLQSEMKFPKEYYEKGRFDMREEMMKALVNGEIVKNIHDQLRVTSEPLNNAFGDIKFGDKVKIIIVKEGQQ